MRNVTIKISAAVTVLVFMCIVLPMSAFATGQNDVSNSTALESTGKADHAALARHYEEQANEMYGKIEEQIETLKKRSRSSYLGKRGRDIKKHVKYKIQEFEKAAEESLEKAAYHKKMAGEHSSQPVLAESGNTKS
ncbi:hypothetical protein SAMN05421690_1001112 [Nitrosomonas sp. Nm51]|uniref:hypothetical protein n=1 Tax=Nitrosomonas sp. Nm51 TaxID=133720 RepID=UPI0008CECABB|nr:hypothetical protein [Nitrosomonas sp. Nm51]SEQ77637.1 hypothetical protein SAMN05421690_1001112 [Nitrosomonas sp. Nm51]